MPLPGADEASTAWPPPSEEKRLARMREARTWYGGDRGELASLYGGGTTAQSHIATTVNPDGKGIVQRALGALTGGRYWSSTVAEGEPDTRRHLPIAHDIAIQSSEWLYGEPPTFTVEGPVYEADGPAIPGRLDAVGKPVLQWRAGDPMPDTVTAQKRLDKILAATNIRALLLQGGEIASALGSIPLRIVADTSMPGKMPRLVRVDPNVCVPRVSWGAITGVVFWRTVTVGWISSQQTLRHLELHEGGQIIHGLYLGSPTMLGTRIPMDQGDATCQGIAPNLDEAGALKARFEYIPEEGGAAVPAKTAASIPNVLPDPLDLENLVGRSDYTPGVIDLMDAADRIYSQFMENVEDAKGRILIARRMLESAGVGRGLSFDASQRYFTKLNSPPAEKEGGGLPLEKVQFELRAAEYLSTLEAIASRAVESAGWSVDSDADTGGRDITATEVRDKRTRSSNTRDKKLLYVEGELEELATGLLVADKVIFGTDVKPYPVRVEFPESAQPSLMELANVAEALRRAKAASDEVLVRIIHPTWTDGEIAEEVARLSSAARTIDPATIGLSARLPGDALPASQPEPPPAATDTPEEPAS